MKKFAAIYSIVIGVGMIAMWLMFYFSGQIPELDTKFWEILMHLIAEFSTAILLIIGGFAYLANKSWGKKLYLLATGMLFYTLIVSPGYYIQRSNWGFVAMFAFFFVLALPGAISAITKASK